MSDAEHGDERLAFRGPLQRLMISPEIGAFIGATMVWVLFWSAGQLFGQAQGTASWLDVAAKYGIMSVAVALLMIGGEFDLSSGVIVGSTGIFVGIFGQKFLGTGGPMWLGVLLAFIAAGMIGFLNGWLVNRTGLPSFIVTLATFYVLRGANLVFTKRMMSKVTVENINETKIKGLGFFKSLFAHQWLFQKFSGRDAVFLALVLLGVVLLVGGVLEQSLRRREDGHALGALVPLAVGLAGAGAGLVIAHRTDGVGANVLAAVLGLGGAVVAIVAAAGLRYQRAALSGPVHVPRATWLSCIGLALAVIGVLATRSMGIRDRRPLLSIPDHPVKVVVAAVTAVAVAAVTAWWHARRMAKMRAGQQSIGPLTIGLAVVTTLLAGGAAMVGMLGFLQQATMQGFRALLLVGLGTIGISMMLAAKGRARRRSARAQLVAGLLASAAILAFGFVLRHDAHVARFRAGLFTALALLAAIVLANTLIEALYAKRSGPDTPADRLGRLLVGLGVAAVGAAMVLRVLFSGQRVYASLAWWVGITAVVAFVLARTKWGNWIQAVGGNKEAARAVGVPVNQVKIGLFMLVSILGCLVGIMQAVRFSSVPAGTGIGDEFDYIIGAVVGGCLMTGGYGSVIGAAVGATIAPMAQIGITQARWNSDNRFVFLGVVLLLAVLVNQRIRKKAQEAR